MSNMKCQIRLARNLQPDSIVDGLGIRTVVWTQGCSHKCLGCHNGDTWDFNGGFLTDIEKVKEDLLKIKDQDGITLTGGDPFFQVAACLELAKFAHENNLNVWCYTGFRFEELMEMSSKNPKVIEFLKQIDILIDGRFEIEKRSLNLKFRGSTNQRILDVKKSLKRKKPVSIKDYDPKQEFERTNTQLQNVYI